MDDELIRTDGRWTGWLHALTAPLTLLAPPRCVACRVRGPIPWCGRCQLQVRELPVAGCPRCAAPRRPGHPCWPADAPIAGTVAALDYRGPVAAAIVSAKVAGAHAGWPPLAAMLARRVALAPPAVDAVTWVRTAATRRRRRGVDHAELLARAVAEALELPLVATLEARAGPDGRDRYRATHRFPGSELLLVDDVLTTGATAVRAATALLAAGAGRPHLAVVARAGPHPLAGPVRPTSGAACPRTGEGGGHVTEVRPG
jgi:predicted amidophosphoribosyltransferase